MATKRYINTKFWSDPFIQELDNKSKLFYIYLLTNSHTNIAGIYEVSLKTMSFESGISEHDIKEILDSLSKAMKAYFVDGFIIIRNFLKHQSINPKVEAGIKRVMSEIPHKIKEFVESEYSLTIGYDSLSHLTLLNLTLPNPTLPNRDGIEYVCEKDSIRPAIENKKPYVDILINAYPRLDGNIVEAGKYINEQDYNEAEVKNILAKIKSFCLTEAWLKKSGQYIPSAENFFKQERWRGNPSPEISPEVREAQRVQELESAFF